MRFAKFVYAKDNSEIPINRFVRLLPKPAVDFYIQKRNPFTFMADTILGEEGYIVKLPLTIAQAKENYRRNEQLVMRTFEQMKEKQVGIVIAPYQDILMPECFKLADGKAVFAFLLPTAIKSIFKMTRQSLKNANFVLIDGGNFISDLILDCLYPEVNYLCIYTDRVKKLQEKAEEIFEDTGLNIQIFSNNKNALLREADVIINGANELENYDYFFKKHAIYFDVNRNRQKLKRLLSKRKDMLFVDNLETKINGCYLKLEALEAYLYLTNEDFRRMITSQYNQARQMIVKRQLENGLCSISSFYCNFKRLGDSEFNTLL